MRFAAFSGVFIEHSIHEALHFTKRLGMDGIEIAVREPHLSPSTSAPRVREMRRLADDLGIQIPALAGYMGGFSTASDRDAERAYDEFRQLLERADQLGASMVRVFPGGPHAFKAQDYHYAKAAYWLSRCAEAALAHNVNIVLEIHNHSLTETVDSGLRLLDLIEHVNIGLTHDAGNMYITDTDFGRESVLRLGRRLFHVHVKDELRVDELGAPGTFADETRHGEEKFQHTRLGEGGADHQPLFDTLLEIGYEGWVTLECHAALPAYERLEYDFEVIKQMLRSSSSSRKDVRQ